MKSLRFKTILCTALIAALTFSAGSFGVAAAALDTAQTTGAGDIVPQTDDPLPQAYSSRDLGYVTSVKAQDYNSCWAYASMATYESLLLRNGIGQPTDDISVNHLNMWATTRTNGKGWQRDIACDGYPSIALGYLTSWQGGVYVSDLGNDPLDFNTKGDEVPDDLARYGVTAVRYLSKGDNDAIKRAIMNNGGVYSSYAHSASCMSSDGTAYFMPPSYDDSRGYAGHSIEVVGWDDAYPRANFNGSVGVQPENDGAWLIKNSWGDNNDLGGFFWMSYEDKYLFGTKFVPSYTLESFETLDGTKKLIQNEIYGATYEFKYVSSPTITFMNRLQFDPDYNVIDKVVFKTDAAGAAYSIHYVPDGAGQMPDPDKTHWTTLYEGTVDYRGYICADIEDFTYPDAAGTLAVTIDASAVNADASLGVGEWLTASGDYVFINDSHRGESFIQVNGETQDLMDWYQNNENDPVGGTFVIKAVTTMHYEPTLLGDSNLDGKVNINDVTDIQRHLAEIITLTKTARANADYNQDGKITVEDATAIQRMLAEFTD